MGPSAKEEAGSTSLLRRLALLCWTMELVIPKKAPLTQAGKIQSYSVIEDIINSLVKME
jgi:hypothetical protein